MARSSEVLGLEDDPLWYKDAIIYELHVRAFCDSDADGVGDFRGLTQKLDYLQDLGVTALWLMPFYPSPLRDEGYDIADYAGVHPAYGSFRDFQTFLREAHRRGLRVITELVLNHSSDQHPWFVRARRAPRGSRWRNFYVWADQPDRYRIAPVLFKDFEASNWAWDPVAQAYYWHRFFSHQPDLNFHSPSVRRAVLQVVDFWLRVGIDGMRLDAIPYLYEREGTTCEDLPETHAFLRALRAYVDRKYANRMLLAEANLWPEQAVSYFGEADECHMAFHFPLMPRLFMAIRMEDRFPITDVLRQTPQLPESCQWALFLRNHDELTLSTVTDEDRDYMYRAYALDAEARLHLGIRRRLAPLLSNQRRKIELMMGLLFSLPGTPVIYYGDELGMGDNIYLGDRNGVRTPMQWSADRNAGFSRANPQRLYLPVIVDPEYHYETVNVEAEQASPHSLLWWTKRLIALRRRFRALGRGSIEFPYAENPKVLVFLRRYRDERVLIVANLSRFAQAAELDLASLRGTVPVEVFGHTPFPTIGDQPYLLTLGPHSFYWFSLERPRVEASLPAEIGGRVPVLGVLGSREALLSSRGKTALESGLPTYLRGRNWFVGAGRTIQAVRIEDAIPIERPHEPPVADLLVLRVEYVEGEPEAYLLPVAIADGARAEQIFRNQPHAVVVRLPGSAQPGGAVLYDALWDPETAQILLEAIRRRQEFEGQAGRAVGVPLNNSLALRSAPDEPFRASVLPTEQRHTSVAYGEQFILKMFRHLPEGVSAEVEVGRFLRERTDFDHAPRLAGLLEYRRRRGEAMTLGVLHEYLPNQGDAWRYSLEELARFFERVLAEGAPSALSPRPSSNLGGGAALSLSKGVGVGASPPALASVLGTAQRGLPTGAVEAIGPYLETAKLLGQRTGELHLALARDGADPNFGRESLSPFDQRSLYHSMRAQGAQVFQLLRRRANSLPERLREEARDLLLQEEATLDCFRCLLDPALELVRIRTHGDYHLAEVLHLRNDVAIIDFEGDPTRPASERRLKRLPLRDVASMVRSFGRVGHAALEAGKRGALRPHDLALLEPWTRFWQGSASGTFLGSYLQAVAESGLVPRDATQLGALWAACLMERAMSELGHELENRSQWVAVALAGVRQALEEARAEG